MPENYSGDDHSVKYLIIKEAMVSQSSR